MMMLVPLLKMDMLVTSERRATIKIPDDMTGPPATISNTGVGNPLQMRTMNTLKMH
jgi:hypothetical protein